MSVTQAPTPNDRSRFAQFRYALSEQAVIRCRGQAREIIVRHHKYAWVLMGLSILIVTGVFFRKEFIQAATYTFPQSSWVGGATANTANHTSNQTGWTQYSATSTSVILNGSNYPTLSATSYAFVDDGATSTTPSLATSGGGFSNGANSSTTVSGSGAGASVRLSIAETGNIWSNTGSTIPGAIGYGSAMAAIPGDGIYVLRGGITSNFYRYATSTNTWTTLTSTPASSLVYTGGTLVYPGYGEYLYSTTGRSSYDFYRYSTTTNSWSALASTTVAVTNSGSLTSDRGDYLYGILNNAINLYQYKISTNTWSDTGPTSCSTSGASAYVHVYGPDLYGSCGNNGRTFSNYATTTNAWTTLTNTPAAFASQGSIVYPGSGSYTYSIRGAGTTDFFRYSTTTNSWAAMASTTGTNAQGSNIVYPGSGNYIYGIHSSLSTSLYKYTINDAYASSGTFTPAVIDTGGTSAFTTLNYTTTLNSQTITVDAHAGNTATPDGSWTSWQTSIASGGSISGLAGNRYIQYRANLSTNNTTVTPTLDSVTINFNQYATSGNLTSSPYNTETSSNLISKLTWAGSTTTTETIKFQMRSSTDGATWSGWCGGVNDTTCNGTTYFTDSDNGVSFASGNLLRSGGNDQYLQYKVFLASGGSATPTLTSVTATYIVNAPPSFDATYGTNGISVSQVTDSASADYGKVTISYKIRDVDTSTGSTNPGYVTPSFEYNVGAGWVAISSNLAGGDTSNKVVDNSTYNTYTAVWTASSTVTANTSGAQVRVTINDNEAANNTAVATSGTFTLDTTVPVISSAVIDSSVGASTVSGNTAGAITLTITDSSAKQYRLCNDTAFPSSDTQGNSCAWTATTTTISGLTISNWVFTGANSAESVYLQARDAYGNVTVQTLATPAMPTNLLSADTSNPSANTYGETLSWLVVPTASTYNVYYATTSPSGPAPTSFTFLANTASNVYTHSIPTNATSSAYWYRVSAINSALGVSNLTIMQTGGDVPDSYGTSIPDTTPPVITNISASSTSIRSTSAMITFTTDELATARVVYSTTPGTCDAYASSGSKVTTAYVTSQAVTLDSLTPGSTYYYCVKATDVLGNVSNYSTPTPTSFATVGGPTISSVGLQNLAGNTVTITWNTATTSDSYVYYSTNSSLTNPTIVGSATMVTCTGPSVCQHQVGLSGLTAGITYYYKVKSTDPDGNSVEEANHSLLTLSDTTAPAIVGTIDTPVKAPTAAVIVWQTDEPATSQVNWGLASTSLTRFTTNDTTRSVYHVVTLSSATTDLSSVTQELTPETAYYFTVKSADAANNLMTSSVQTFTTPSTGNITVTSVIISNPGDPKDTTPPSISNVVVSDITPFGATVKFDASEDTDGFVKYGKDLAFADSSGDDAWAKTHTIKLRGLTLGTEYHIKVTAHDKAGNTGSSGDQSFKTAFLSENLKDLTKIENIEAFQKEIENTIESILPSLVPPFVSKPTVGDITESSATVSFKTNIKAFPVVVYAEDGAFDETKENPYIGEISDTSEKSIDHEIKITGLKGNTKYHVQARGFSLPKVIGKSPDVTFITKASKIAGSIVERRKDSFTVVWTTDEPTSSIVEYKDLKRGITQRKIDEAKKSSHSMKIENLPSGTSYEVNLSGMTEQGNIAEGGSSLSVTTSTDTIPPTISGFKVDNALVPGRTDRIQTIVSWITDEPANGTVYYEEGAGTAGDTSELANKNEILDSYITQHSVILPSLKPGTIYRLKVVSNDDSGNKGTFGPRTVITPKQTESITDIIFKNFEDSFKFLRKI